MNRKDFIGRLARIGFLGALAAISGILVGRRQVSLHRECGLEKACGDCSKRGTCKWADDEKG